MVTLPGMSSNCSMAQVMRLRREGRGAGGVSAYSTLRPRCSSMTSKSRSWWRQKMAVLDTECPDHQIDSSSQAQAPWLSGIRNVGRGPCARMCRSTIRTTSNDLKLRSILCSVMVIAGSLK